MLVLAIEHTRCIMYTCILLFIYVCLQICMYRFVLFGVDFTPVCCTITYGLVDMQKSSLALQL